MAIELRHMTASEFLKLPETNLLHELINGEEFISPTPTVNHQRISGRLYTLLNSLIPDGEVFFAPMGVYLDEFNIPEPDLLWVSANSTTARITEKQIEGAPDLIVEILSPGTALRDKKDKFALYQKYGVREYWMVDPVEQYIEIWWREGDRLMRAGIYGAKDECVSPLLGKIELTAVFQQ